MVAACLPAGGEGGEEEVGEVIRGGGGKGCAAAAAAAPGGGWGEKGAAGKRKGAERISLPRWKLKGASLLWRYTRGVGGVQ